MCVYILTKLGTVLFHPFLIFMSNPILARFQPVNQKLKKKSKARQIPKKKYPNVLQSV